jgi:aspartokinase
MNSTNPGGGYVETIAVYREERVKVYGITRRDGLCLAIFRYPVQNLRGWGQRLAALQATIGRFELVTGQSEAADLFQLQLVLPETAQNGLTAAAASWPRETGTEWRSLLKVTMFYLHGPHFQDRYGIADIAVNALVDAGLQLLLSGCAGTSMYLVVPATQGDKGMEILRQTFLIPTSG